jgi:hypothetical protein
MVNAGRIVRHIAPYLLTDLMVGAGLPLAQPVGLSASLIRADLAGKPVLDSILRLLPLAVGLGVLPVALLAALERYVFAPMRLLVVPGPAWI